MRGILISLLQRQYACGGGAETLELHKTLGESAWGGPPCDQDMDTEGGPDATGGKRGSPSLIHRPQVL